MSRIRAVLALAAAAVLGVPPAALTQTAEDAVKATFLYRFASFVSWPRETFADDTTPVRLCVFGADPFARLLTQVVTNQRTDGRAFEVRALQSAGAAEQCHAVYVVGDRVDATLRAVRGRPVLTVTDGALAGSDTRGTIHFVIVEDRVRFHIDDARAGESHLRIDPRLLTLAISVRRRPAP